MIIAIDGPAGSGKSTVAKLVAKRLNYRYIDTGAMYRAVAWMATHEGLALDDEPALAALAERVELTLDGQTVLVEGHDVTREVDPGAEVVQVVAVELQPDGHAVDAGLRRRGDDGQPRHRGFKV